jgi:hypothetical protein
MSFSIKDIPREAIYALPYNISHGEISIIW